LPPPPTTRGGSPHPGGVDSNGHKQQYLAARSKHPGGINASRCDGSADFFSDDIELRVWDEMCSAASGKPINR
jgi:prepilin-type processing-associated H-X9-DG protein